MRRPLVVLLAVATITAATAALVAGIPAGGRTGSRAQAAVTLSAAHAGAALPSFKSRITFLVAGSDQGAPSFHRGGDPAKGRSDALHLVVLDAAQRRGIVIGIPRDSYVTIPGHGQDKINAAMSDGGPALLVATVEAVTGIHVDYFLLTAFDNFIALVNRVGGIEVNVDQRMHDRFAGSFLAPGRQHLNGAQALAFARARETVPNGDFGRSKHQGDMLLGGLATFQQQMHANPAAVLTWLAIMHDEVVRTTLPLPQTFQLALFALSVPPSRLHNVVLSGTTPTIGGASVVQLDGAAFALLARVRAGGYA